MAVDRSSPQAEDAALGRDQQSSLLQAARPHGRIDQAAAHAAAEKELRSNILKAQINELAAELFAAEVCCSLARIAKAQHRIACALAGEQRPAVLSHLRSLGISDEAALAYAGCALSSDQLADVTRLLDKIQGWRPHLASRLASLSVAEKN
jgi:hypothetical protein